MYSLAFFSLAGVLIYLSKIRQRETKWVKWKDKFCLPLCAILSCLLLLFSGLRSVFLAKTKAFFKKHFKPYHITITLLVAFATGLFFIKTALSYLGANGCGFWFLISDSQLRRTKKTQLFSWDSRVMFVIFHFLSLWRTAKHVPICIFVLFELFTSAATIQGN